MTPARAHSSWVMGCQFPSPLWGEVRGGGREVLRGRRRAHCSRLRRSIRLPTPHPTLPRKGGGRRCAQRLRRVREIAREVLAGSVAVVHRLDRAALVFLDAAAFLHPFDARARQALLQIERHIGIGVGAGRIVDRERRLAGGGIEHDLAQRHFQVRRRVGRRVNLARAGDRSGGDLRRGEIGFGDMFVHWGYS